MRSRRSDRSPDSRRAGGATQTRLSPAREPSATRDQTRAPRKPKICVRCEKKIDDGKWVAVDGGGVLCEKCWKNMYLPKCRRCNLPIEKQAVSSSDGQLKGKYHRECFNCFTCQKPFPDKTFYVHEGKPLCAYHYHEANDSLCAAARWGSPSRAPARCRTRATATTPSTCCASSLGRAGARSAWMSTGRLTGGCYVTSIRARLGSQTRRQTRTTESPLGPEGCKGRIRAP
ncbi:hypothetical protein K438DRAFT_1226604 [Mycena galopus ATCC 62051]|nr:hypothetical protein K438DRAFT_1226604 [Mycena galopus ATCC 62051]